MMASYRLDWTRDETGTGWLCIVYSCPLWSAPTLVSHWWPVLTCGLEHAREAYESPVHDGVRDEGDGYFSFPWLMGANRSELGRRSLRLRDGGSTQPIRTDREPIPPPPRVQTRYERGRWWRLAREGWVESG